LGCRLGSWEGGAGVKLWYNNALGQNWVTFFFYKHKGKGEERTLYCGPVSEYYSLHENCMTMGEHKHRLRRVVNYFLNKLERKQHG